MPSSTDAQPPLSFASHRVPMEEAKEARFNEWTDESSV